jgi:hypothetical protein
MINRTIGSIRSDSKVSGRVGCLRKIRLPFGVTVRRWLACCGNHCDINHARES